jgi:hypothetical protein
MWAMNYVFLLQLLGFMYGWLTFYHQGHEVANEFKPYMRELQFKIQKVMASRCSYSLLCVQDSGMSYTLPIHVKSQRKREFWCLVGSQVTWNNRTGLSRILLIDELHNSYFVPYIRIMNEEGCSMHGKYKVCITNFSWDF